MTRRKKALLNGIVGFLKQIIVVVCGFILPRYILLFYGSSINGLVSSVTHFLGFISLLEMGIGPVIQANLYKPLAQKDEITIGLIVASAQRFYRKIAIVFLFYIVFLIVVFPRMINSEYDYLFTGSLVIIIAISIFAQYFFGATYQALLNASQNAFVQNILQIITVVLNTVISVVLITRGASIHIVKLTTSLLFLFRPIGQMIYVSKHIPFKKQSRIIGEPIKQKWNGFAQHIAGWVCSGTDTVVLTLFSTLENISIYSVYYSVTVSLTNLVITMATGVEALFGDMIAKQEYVELDRSFSIIEFYTHVIVTFIFTVAGVVIVPFVSVYTIGVNDANYITPLFAVLLVLAYATQAIRVPYARIIFAAGHFKETQVGAIISALLNIIITVLLVFKYGLVGTAIGTFVAMFYHTVYYVVYLNKHILVRPLSIFFRLLLSDSIVFFIMILISYKYSFVGTTYVSWIIYSIKISLLTGSVLLMVSIILNKSETICLLKRVFNKFLTMENQ